MNTNLTEDEAASIIQTKYREYHSHKPAQSGLLSEVNQTALKELNDDRFTEFNKKEDDAARCIQRSYRKHFVKQKKVTEIKAEEHLSEREYSEINFPEPTIESEPDILNENEALVDNMGDCLSSTENVERGAASTIQYHYRQYKARMAVRKKEQEKAVKVIEKNYLQYKEIRERRMLQEDEKNNAAIKIQRQFRIHQKTNKDKVNIQPVVSSHEERENAALTIQRNFRQHQRKKEQLEPNAKISPKLKSLNVHKQERKKSKNNNRIQSDMIQLNTLKKSSSSPVKKVKKTRDIEDLVPREELLDKKQEAPDSEDEPELADLYDTSTAEVVNCTSSSEGVLKTESHNSLPLNPAHNIHITPHLEEVYYQAEDVQMITVHGDLTPTLSHYDYSEEETTPSHKSQPSLVTTFVPGTLDGYAVRNLLKKSLPPPSRQKKAPDSYLQQFLKKMDSPKKGHFRTGRTLKTQALCTKEQQNNQGYHKNFDNLISRPLPNLAKIARYGREVGNVNCKNRYRHYGYRPIDENHALSKGMTRGGYYPVIPAYGRLKENEVRKQKNTELQEIPWPTDG